MKTPTSRAVPNRKLSIRYTEAEYRILTERAQAAGYSSPSSYLHHLGIHAALPNYDPTWTPPAPASYPLSHQVPEIAEQVYAIQQQLQDAAAAIRQIPHIESLIRSTILQATSASYMAIQIWRMLADQNLLPPAGIPPHMLNEIRTLHQRALTSAEEKAHPS
jgi:hypothetical protein